jgi:hypothetical protein
MPADFPVGVVDALPVLKITTAGSAPILSKETYVNGNFELTGVGMAPVDGALEIRGRGNSTWSWVKKPYRLKLANSTEMLGIAGELCGQNINAQRYRIYVKSPLGNGIYG